MKTIVAFILGATIVGVSSGVMASDNFDGYTQNQAAGDARGSATGKFNMSFGFEGSADMKGNGSAEGTGRGDGSRYYGLKHPRYIQTSCVTQPKDAEIDTYNEENGYWS